jgi:hypothetical protein
MNFVSADEMYADERHAAYNLPNILRVVDDQNFDDQSDLAQDDGAMWKQTRVRCLPPPAKPTYAEFLRLQSDWVQHIGVIKSEMTNDI